MGRLAVFIDGAFALFKLQGKLQRFPESADILADTFSVPVLTPATFRERMPRMQRPA